LTDRRGRYDQRTKSQESARFFDRTGLPRTMTRERRQPGAVIDKDQAARGDPESFLCQSLGRTMIATESTTETRHVRGVSVPGGMARQYRVQVRRAGEAHWRRHATFRRADLAEALRTRLEHAGWDARVVGYKICAAA
jgi:hypothetical protein